VGFRPGGDGGSALGQDRFTEGTLRNAVNRIDPIRPAGSASSARSPPSTATASPTPNSSTRWQERHHNRRKEEVDHDRQLRPAMTALDLVLASTLSKGLLAAVKDLTSMLTYSARMQYIPR
jgi:hypothetical protein